MPHEVDEATGEIVKYEPRAIEKDLTSPETRAAVVDELEAQVKLIQEAMSRTLVKGVHYGTIPGTPKPSLWQPGAEMLCQMFRFQTDLTRTGEHEDWDKGIFSYTYKCRLLNRNGELITEREGTCSSKEPNYASKNAFQIRETLMQMAQKRAYVAAVRGAGACSAIFSQDDDIVPNDNGDRGAGICPTHNVPYLHTEKQKAAGYPPSHKLDNGDWCVKEDRPAPPPVSDTQKDATAALNELFSTSQERISYVEDVLGKSVGKPGDLTEEEWEKVKESAVGDLAEVSEEYNALQGTMDPQFEANQPERAGK